MARVLIIEDDPNTLSGLEDLLRADGYWVIGVMRGRQAMPVAATRHIDVVLCDYKLPDIDGLQVCRELKRLYPELKLLLFTAYNNFELAGVAKECGIMKILQKPLDMDELFATLCGLSSPANGKRVLYSTSGV